MTPGQMSIKVLQVAGIDHALRWMRYAKQTENDSEFTAYEPGIKLGPKDKRLIRALIKAHRDSHSKTCRVIQVWMDINMPLKWWKQFDTYKIGTTALSTSTMNNLMDGVLDLDFDHTVDIDTIDRIKHYIKMQDEEKAQGNLPLGYLQLRGVNLNYQVLRNIYLDREHHKLAEWQVFLDAVREQCPYSEELIFIPAKVTLEKIIANLGGSIASLGNKFIWTADAISYDDAWEQKCDALEFFKKFGVVVDEPYTDHETVQIVFEL